MFNDSLRYFWEDVLKKDKVLAAMLSSVFFAAAVTLAKFTRGHDPILLTTLQFATCGIFGWLLQIFVVKALVAPLTSANISALLYLTVLCSAVALTFQS